MEIWKDPKSIIIWLFVGLLVALILTFFIIALIKLTYKKAIEKEQAVFNEKLKHEEALKKTIVQVQDQERKVIASELHDQISNKLNLVLLQLNNLSVNDLSHIDLIKQDIKKVIAKNRDISHYLFPVEIDNVGIFSTLTDLSIKYFSDKFKINLIYNPDIVFVDKQIELNLYRIVQESLTNTLKYSDATFFDIHFRKFKDHVFLVLSDNGSGCNLSTVQNGLGFKSITTRLHVINAKYKFKSQDNCGFRLIILL